LREHVQKEEFPARTRDKRTRNENAQPGMAAAPAWVAALLPLDINHALAFDLRSISLVWIESGDSIQTNIDLAR
jgi:hypothetical protein